MSIPNEQPMSGVIDAAIEVESNTNAEWIWKPLESISLEDPRVFFDNGTKYFVCTQLQTDDEKRFYSSMMILSSSTNNLLPLLIDNPRRFEKNWVPFKAFSGKFVLLYRSIPFTLLTFSAESNHKKATVSILDNKHALDYNGGTIFVELPNGNFLRIARFRYRFWKFGLIHLNYALLYDCNLKLLKESSPFIFRGLGFETCNGAWIEDSHLILSWTEDDKHSFIGKIEIENFLIWQFDTKHRKEKFLQKFKLLVKLTGGFKLSLGAEQQARVRVPKGL
jgi:hypothetical protein